MGILELEENIGQGVHGVQRGRVRLSRAYRNEWNDSHESLECQHHKDLRQRGCCDWKTACP